MPKGSSKTTSQTDANQLTVFYSPVTPKLTVDLDGEDRAFSWNRAVVVRPFTNTEDISTCPTPSFNTIPSFNTTSKLEVAPWAEESLNFLQKPTEIISTARVRNLPQLEDMPASDIWRNGPAFVFVVRRPGCEFCRAQAILIGHVRRLLTTLGYTCVAVLSEQDEDVGMFEKVGFFEGAAQRNPVQNAWRSRLYLDEKQSFYQAVGGGKLRTSSFRALLSPRFIKLVKKTRAWGVKGNIKQTKTGNILGGMLLVAKGEGEETARVQYIQPESTFGDFGNLDDIIYVAYRYSPRRSEVDLEEVERMLAEHHVRVSGSGGPLTLCEDDLCMPLFERPSISAQGGARKGSLASLFGGEIRWGFAL